MSITQVAFLMESTDSIMHVLLLTGVLLVLFEVAVLLGDVIGSRDRDSQS
jgi:hypothetical protein